MSFPQAVNENMGKIDFSTEFSTFSTEKWHEIFLFWAKNGLLDFNEIVYKWQKIVDFPQSKV